MTRNIAFAWAFMLGIIAMSALAHALPHPYGVLFVAAVMTTFAAVLWTILGDPR